MGVDDRRRACLYLLKSSAVGFLAAQARMRQPLPPTRERLIACATREAVQAESRLPER